MVMKSDTVFTAGLPCDATSCTKVFGVDGEDGLKGVEFDIFIANDDLDLTLEIGSADEFVS